ncbi:MAG: chemotaxis protein CheR, partial [Candidatus Marinimicrobia bacterium]|nr:chemotaxis protein CheR [Candidatus Neomarinimicrobiota bacterium]
MDPKIFQQFRKIIKKHSGIELTENKEALLTARVGKRMRKLDISEYKAYLKFLLDDKSGKEMVALLDVISTNVTSFYREAVHFEFLKPILQEWENQGKTRYRVWCAAASSGEEPFTIAITMQESLNKMVDGKILATDIST